MIALRVGSSRSDMTFESFAYLFVIEAMCSRYFGSTAGARFPDNAAPTPGVASSNLDGVLNAVSNGDVKAFVLSDCDPTDSPCPSGVAGMS